ncbi:MAG TPA: uracil-DNA glycosylase family protein [Bryobacteraceae bacterium]|nr:uracil-DNA glycosylase family protein [Bryobacteraceae bacterium]
MSPEEIRRVLEYYQDLGIKTIYRRGSQLTAKPMPSVAAPEPVLSFDDLPPLPPKSTRPAASTKPAPVPEESLSWDDLPPLPPRSGRGTAQASPPPRPSSLATAPPSTMLDIPSLIPDNDSLEQIRTDIGDCKRCRLCEGRNKIVFGSGNESSPLVFVGEGPGADEDASGLPFVGRAGQLLTQMIEGTAAKENIPIKRPDVYICNVVKCRPPENRAPQPDEMEICGQFLFRQLSAIKPKAICALGSTAAKAVLGTKDGVTKLRGNWHKWRDVPVMVTYHPSYLLRPYNQNAKREAWEDLKKVLHFVYD